MNEAMTAPETRKDKEAGDPHSAAKRVRSLVEETRKSSGDLVAAGVDRQLLEDKLARIENHLDQEHHDPVVVESLLTELRSDLIKVENRLIDSGVLQLLHQILGTGVPPPR